MKIYLGDSVCGLVSVISRVESNPGSQPESAVTPWWAHTDCSTAATAACSYTPPSTFLTHFYVILTPDTPGLPGTPSGGLMGRAVRRRWFLSSDERRKGGRGGINQIREFRIEDSRQLNSYEQLLLYFLLLLLPWYGLLSSSLLAECPSSRISFAEQMKSLNWRRQDIICLSPVLVKGCT